MADDEDPVELSAHTLNALNEFYREQELLQAGKDEIDEDWELSQFWYDDETSTRLAEECLRLISNLDQARIACISCPTLYKTLRKTISLTSQIDGAIGNATEKINRPQIDSELSGTSKIDLRLFEFDSRFERYGDDFVVYDYRLLVEEILQRSNPKGDLRNSFDVIVADPPFLSEECASKVCEFVRALSKLENGKIIFCTGLVAENFVLTRLEKMRICEKFEPRHKSKLGNEFRCYVNYDGAFPLSCTVCRF